MEKKGIVVAYGRLWSRKLSEKRMFRDIPKIRKKRIGLYVLCKRERVVYIGKSEANLRNRIETHTKDRLRNKWDSFSWFFTRPKYTSDLEALLHKVFGPPGVITRGGFIEAKKCFQIKNIYGNTITNRKVMSTKGLSW